MEVKGDSSYFDCERLCLKLYNVCCCSSCCCKQLKKAVTDSRHPHILYAQLAQHQDSHTDKPNPSSSEQHSSEKTHHKYPQKYREYSIPPQLGREDESVVVKRQPRALRSISASGSEVKKERRPLIRGQGSKSMPDIDPYGSIPEDPFDSTEDQDDTDIGYVDLPPDFSAKRPSVATIERSPDATLERGRHIEFPLPKRLSISTIRKMDSFLVSKLEELQKPLRSPEIPGVHFSLSFDEEKGTLIVHLSHAINLPTSRPKETSNPFVQIYLLPIKSEVLQSHSVQGTHSPQYDRLFRFSKLSMDTVRKSALVMRFYVNKQHFIGGVLYGLEEADVMGDRTVQSICQYDEEEGLKESCQGDILLTVCYHSMTNVLEVLVLEITNLTRQDILRQPNPYIKMNIIHKGQRLSKLKTSTKKGTCNPIFNELFEIDLSSMNLEVEDLQLDLFVMNYDRLGHNTVMGGVSFGDHVMHKSGQSHWKKAMIETNSNVTMWHPLTLFRKSPPPGLVLDQLAPPPPMDTIPHLLSVVRPKGASV